VHPLIVVSPPAASTVPKTGVRISIFPGSATPAMFAARTPFWIGYGFAAGPGGRPTDDREVLGVETRFELDLDGRPVRLVTDLQLEEGFTVSKLDVANFPEGLEAGWHRFVGRWYDEGALVLSSDKNIEFIE